MSHGKEIFTDAIKDVIGNDPVVDQFDIDYEASFYGTMVDDYVTGTMLVRSGGRFSTPSRLRGRLFSKYYADSQPTLSSQAGSDDVRQAPLVSQRLVPWHNRASRTSYRVSQCYDANERYYDSCLPNFKRCLDVDGAQVWTTSNDPRQMLSPYRNVASYETGSIGYLLFNSLKFDSTTTGYDGSVVTDNDWTFSYPYESRYSPDQRLLKTDAAFGVTETALGLKWDDAAGVYNTSSFGGLFKNDLQVLRPRRIKSLLPLLPGRLNANDIGTSTPFRNSFRSYFYVSGSDGLLPFAATTVTSSISDNELGISYLIPSDVRLDTFVSHSYLNVYLPGTSDIMPPEPLTGTMTFNDTTKMLFGFGDLNNMTWGRRLFVSSSGLTPYSEGFEVTTGPASASYIPPDIYANNGFSPSLSALLKVSWVDDSTTSGTPFKVACREGSIVDVNGVLGADTTKTYNWISASSGSPSLPPFGIPLTNVATQGLFWETENGDESGVNSFVLISTVPSPDNVAKAALDITSSVPWSLRFKRAVACGRVYGGAGATTQATFSDRTVTLTSSYLMTSLEGKPMSPSQPSAINEWNFPASDVLDVTFGSDVDTGPVVGKMSQYDSLRNSRPYATSFKTGYPFTAGEYRISFRWGGFTTATDPHICAIDDIEIIQYTEEALQPDPSARIGGNNYPEFRSYKVDARFNPIEVGSATAVTSSANRYQGEVFGVSPIIRGWKHGLVSGFPTNSKAVFRRNRFGQFRDMLEQRPQTKYVSVAISPVDELAIKSADFNEEVEMLSTTTAGFVGATSDGAVTVGFMKQKYVVDARGVGSIYNERVRPVDTTSQNLSTAVTSSLPYFDGVSRQR